ncbi:MAG: hypothetical protein FWH32_06520 [Clostridiales bacterium]|nr:hypothetical protein [Clostridiales bacterium]
MGTVRYISSLAELAVGLIEIANHYSDCESAEFAYIRDGNEVTHFWLSRLEFGYKVIQNKVEADIRVFDLLPLEDGTAAKYPAYFEDQLMVSAMSKKHDALRSCWDETAVQFHKLVRSKVNVIGIFQKRVENGTFSGNLHAALSAELDDIHNEVADSIERLVESYKDYSVLLSTFIGAIYEGRAEAEYYEDVGEAEAAVKDAAVKDAAVEEPVEEPVVEEPISAWAPPAVDSPLAVTEYVSEPMTESVGEPASPFASPYGLPPVESPFTMTEERGE